MKKALKTDLVSLAHKILQLKDTTSYEVLAQNARELYEKLAILQYAERLNIEPQPSAGLRTVELELENLSKEEETSAEEETPSAIIAQKNKEEEYTDMHRPDGTAYNKDEPLHEPVIEKIKDMVAQMPAEADAIDELIEGINPASPYHKNDVFDIAGDYAKIPVFDRVETVVEEERPKNLNDKLKTGVKIGLNDKLAFINHLFEGSDADYNRVLSQLGTFNSLEETIVFINQMVKPDYNNWDGKEEYEARFLQLIENKFN